MCFSLNLNKSTCYLPIQETQETQVQTLGQEDPLEEGMETHYSILAWRIPWTEEPDSLKQRANFKFHGETVESFRTQ